MGEGENGGLYLYCIVPEGGRSDGGAGTPVRDLIVSTPALDGGPVRVVSHHGLSVLVHDCPPEPYQGSDEAVRNWVLAHNAVVVAAWELVDTVLPMSFDSIVVADRAESAESALALWLERHRESLIAQLERLRGQVELGVRVLKPESTDHSAPGKAARGREYFREQAERRREAQGARADIDTLARELFEALADRSAGIRLKPRGTEGPGAAGSGRGEVLAVSLLVPRAGIRVVGEYLDTVRERGNDVRFTGPWPPYSFAGNIDVSDLGVRQESDG